jgi:hypothetical protein
MRHFHPTPFPDTRCAALVLWAALAIAAVPQTAFAGWICGTLRDEVTAAPVAGAGVFARLPGGADTGVRATSDAAGAFCLGELSAGIYDLEIRHDDYATRYLRGVVVTGSTTGVDAALASDLRLLPPSPNPARTQVAFDLRLVSGTKATLAVTDLQGRRIHAWSGEGGGARRIDWNLRDTRGARIPAGFYLVHLETGGQRTTRRFLVIP